MMKHLLGRAVGALVVGPTQEGKGGTKGKKGPWPSSPRGLRINKKITRLHHRPPRCKSQPDEQEKAPECCEEEEVAAFDEGEFLGFWKGAQEGIYDADGGAREGTKPFGPPKD